MLETEVAVAEVAVAEVLGDPMDLIRCQNYLAEPTVANSTHNKTSGTAREVLDKMEKLSRIPISHNPIT